MTFFLDGVDFLFLNVKVKLPLIIDFKTDTCVCVCSIFVSLLQSASTRFGYFVCNVIEQKAIIYCLCEFGWLQNLNGTKK